MVSIIRRLEAAEWWLSLAVVGLVFVGPSSLSFDSQLRWFPLLMLVTGHFVLAVTRWEMPHLIAASVSALPMLHALLSAITGGWCVAIELHALLVVCLVIAAIWKHPAASGIAVVLMALFSLAASLPHGTPLEYFSLELRVSYLVASLALGLTLMFTLRLWLLVPGVVITSACLLFVGGRMAWFSIREVRGWQGLVLYAGGIVCLCFAVVVSWLKSARRANAAEGIGN